MFAQVWFGVGLACRVDDLSPLQVVKMSIEHAGAPLKLESKNDYMKRKIEERSLAPNSQLNGNAEVCALLLWWHTAITVHRHINHVCCATWCHYAIRSSSRLFCRVTVTSLCVPYVCLECLLVTVVGHLCQSVTLTSVCTPDGDRKLTADSSK